MNISGQGAIIPSPGEVSDVHFEPQGNTPTTTEPAYPRCPQVKAPQRDFLNSSKARPAFRRGRSHARPVEQRREHFRRLEVLRGDLVGGAAVRRVVGVDRAHGFRDFLERVKGEQPARRRRRAA